MKHFLLTLMLCMACCTFAQTTLTGKVVEVIDGDTFKMLLDDNSIASIRMYGIDAPEKTGGQPYWRKSKEFLASMIADAVVEVTLRGKDRYGRVLGVVCTKTFPDVNLHMIRYGMAWHYVHFDKTPAYRQAQQEAKENAVGLRASPNPINPYDWRKAHK